MLSLTDEVISFCREYVNDKSQRTPERNEKIKTVYRELTGENVRSSCSTCLVEAILLIYKKTKMEPCKYLLMKGARLSAFGDYSKNATNKNLTNELAEWHLRVNPSCIKRFERVPVLNAPQIFPSVERVPTVRTYPVAEQVEETLVEETNRPTRGVAKARRKTARKTER